MKKYGPLCAAALALICQFSASAAITSEQVKAEITRANVLPPGTSLNVAVNNEEAIVSTFRNTKANDNDCKIDAALISRVIMSMPGSTVTRCTVYFFNRVDRTRYKEVDISAGDVKAFGAGELNKEQLLSSIGIKDLQVADAKTRISSYLQGSQASADRALSVVIDGESVNVQTQLEQWVSDRDAKIEAIRLADKVLASAPEGMKRINITFIDPDNTAYVRKVGLDTSLVKAIDLKIDNALGPVAMSITAPAAGDTLAEVAPGPMQKERAELLAKIRALGKSGVGIGPFMNAFQGLEASVAAGNEAQISADTRRLLDNVAEQEQKIKAAKEKPTATTAASKDNLDSLPPAPPYTGKKPNRQVLGAIIQQEVLNDNNILNNPEQYLSDLQSKITAATGRRADEYPQWALAIRYFAVTLREANKTYEAARFDKRLAQILSKHPNF